MGSRVASKIQTPGFMRLRKESFILRSPDELLFHDTTIMKPPSIHNVQRLDSEQG